MAEGEMKGDHRATHISRAVCFHNGGMKGDHNGRPRDDASSLATSFHKGDMKEDHSGKPWILRRGFSAVNSPP